MPAETVRDAKFEIRLTSEEQAEGDRTTTFVIDSEGRWCDIPCVDNSLTLRSLIEQYYKPQLSAEIQRLEVFRRIADTSALSQKQVFLGSGLFYYEPPDSGLFEEEAWKDAIVQAMSQAGLPVRKIPPQLFPSVHTEKDGFFDYEVHPYNYFPISSLLQKTFVLCPALSYFDPELLTGKNLALGYRSAIGIDGSALLGLLNEDEIVKFKENPELDRVHFATVKNAIKKLLE
jgi:hypothetical protein